MVPKIARPRLSRSLVAWAALPLAAAGAVQAQDQAFVLDEISVFANLAPTGLDRTGSSVTVITEEDLQSSGEVLVSDYLNRLAGITVARTGPAGAQTALRMRGAHQRYTAVYIDGVLVNDPSSPESAFNFGTLTTSDVGRIEVLRGSQSALYGGSAVGGVINITSRSNDGPGISQSAGIEGGSYGTLSARYGFTNRGDRGEVSLNASHFRTDGFSAVEGGAPDGFEATRLSFSARHGMTDDLTLGLSGFTQRSRADYDNWPVDGDLEERRRELGARLFAELETGAASHVFDITAYRIRREDQDLAAGTAADRFRGTRIGASYQGTAQTAPDLTLSWGADIRREVTSGVAPWTGYPRHRETIAGVFAEAQWVATPDLDIALTGRVDRHSEFGTFPTGRLAMAWRAADGLTLRAAVANGYRAPASAERFGPFGNPDLEAETSRSAEIGAEYAFAGGARLSGTLFVLRTDDEITFDAAFNPDNIERTRRRGLELAGSLPLGEHVTLHGAYTYVEAEITAGPRSGQRLSRVPRHDLSLSLEAQLAERLRGTITMQHVADRRDTLTDYSTGPLPDYTVANVSLRYELTPQADLTLRVDNLFNKQYQQVAGYGTSDRAVYAGLAARF